MSLCVNHVVLFCALSTHRIALALPAPPHCSPPQPNRNSSHNSNPSYLLSFRRKRWHASRQLKTHAERLAHFRLSREVRLHSPLGIVLQEVGARATVLEVPVRRLHRHTKYSPSILKPKGSPFPPILLLRPPRAPRAAVHRTRRQKRRRGGEKMRRRWGHGSKGQRMKSSMPSDSLCQNVLGKTYWKAESYNTFLHKFQKGLTRRV
jgi:hypothetical protein